MEVSDTAREAAGILCNRVGEVSMLFKPDSPKAHGCYIVGAFARVIQRAIDKDNAALKAEVERLKAESDVHINEC